MVERPGSVRMSASSFLVSIEGKYPGGCPGEASALALPEWQDDSHSPIIRDILVYPDAVY